jgi:hypothetical protein
LRREYEIKQNASGNHMDQHIILVPVTYYSIKRIYANNLSMKCWKEIEKGELKLETPTAEQQEIDSGYMKNKEDRNKTMERFGLFVFELLSLTGLSVYLANRKKSS